MTTPPAPFEEPDARPSVARMYDYFLGGHHNFPVDRAAAEQIIALGPQITLIAHANRAFLRRAVNALLSLGITQFLDIGSGIPTVGNVHEVAQAANPEARIVYVDIDPLAVTHSASILTGNANATVVQADARRPETILDHPEVGRLLDFSRPIAVLLVSFLHFVTDDDEASALVRGLRDALAPGSYIVISHSILESIEDIPQDVVEQGTAVYNRSSNPVRMRPRSQVARFFDGLEMIEPGLVDMPLWRPEGPDDVYLDTPEKSSFVAGIGRKP